MNPQSTAVPGVHTDAAGNETHGGTGQGGSPSSDHQPDNLGRSGVVHSVPGGGGGNRGPGAYASGSQGGLGKPEPASIART